MAEVIFLVIVAICIIALFAIEGNRAKQLEKLENRIEFLQDRLLELATRTDIQDALLKLKANDPDRKLLGGCYEGEKQEQILETLETPEENSKK